MSSYQAERVEASIQAKINIAVIQQSAEALPACACAGSAARMSRFVRIVDPGHCI